MANTSPTNKYLLILLKSAVLYKIKGSSVAKLNSDDVDKLLVEIGGGFTKDKLRNMFEPAGFKKAAPTNDILDRLSVYASDVFGKTGITFNELGNLYLNNEVVQMAEVNKKREYYDEEIAPVRTWAVNELKRLTGKPGENQQTPLTLPEYHQLKQKCTLRVDAELSGGYYQQKYISKIYYERSEANRLFSQFLHQEDDQLFILTGKAGKGKTNLFCHWADEQARQSLSRHIAVIINAAELNLREQTLIQYIEQYFAPEYNLRFDELASIVGRQPKSKLLVFIDAINELEGEHSFEYFNRQMNELVTRCVTKKLPVLFIVSCRSDFWDIFSLKEWASERVFNSKNLNRSSYEIGDFDLSEIDQVKEKYFAWYALRGDLLGEARLKCCDPIMLRYLCEAHTHRKKDTHPNEPVPFADMKQVHNLRRKKVFDTFVKAIAPRLKKSAQVYIKSPSVRDADLYDLTTKYLLHLAHEMYQRKRSFLTEDEIFEVAVKIGHPDAQLNRLGFLNNKQSIAFTFIDEGIILAKRAERQYDFIFESYFEYSLGRYFALEQWGPLIASGKPEAAGIICENLRELTASHNLLLKENFTNLLASLEYAILAVEEHELYRNHPLLFPDLITLLLNDTEHRVKQVGFTTIRESKLLNETEPQEISAEPDNLRRQKLQRIYDALYTLTAKVDFVIMWDLESTVLKLAAADQDLAIEEMKDWAEEGERIQPLYALQNLVGVCREFESKTRDVVLVIERLSTLPRYRNNFWFARPLILGSYELAVSFKKIEDGLGKILWNIVKGFYLDKTVPYPVRALALSVLPYLAGYKQRYLQEITEFVRAEKYATAVWNLVYELRKWPEHHPTDDVWIRELLKTAAEKKNDHINYAILCVLNACREKEPDQYAELYRQLRRNKWVPNQYPGYTGMHHLQPGKPALIYSPVYLEPSLNNHVECRERLEVILEKIYKHGADRYNWISPSAISEEDLRLVHHAKNDRHFDGSTWNNYLKSVKDAYHNIDKRKGQHDTQSNPSELRYESYPVALVSAGGAVTAVDYVMDPDASASLAWSLGRPPGHLANNKICIFNNIAIAAEYALQVYHLQRILIVDFDAHHGKHTAQTFLHSNQVVYFSIHVNGPYAKEEGNMANIGSGLGKGYSYNIVYPDDMDDDGYIYILDNLLQPLISSFKPQMILLSAGFDGHFEDFLTPACSLTEKSFMYLAGIIRSAMEKDPALKVVGVLEGGYGLEALPGSLMHMLNIIGNLGISEQEIGFTKGAELRKINKNALEEVMEHVKKRIELSGFPAI